MQKANLLSFAFWPLAFWPLAFYVLIFSQKIFTKVVLNIQGNILVIDWWQNSKVANKLWTFKVV